MASSNTPTSSLTMTNESGHKLYMVYSTKSCPELIEQFDYLIESHGDAHGLNDADATFSIRIDYDREHQKGNSGDAETSSGATFKPSKDRAIAALSDKFYCLLSKEGFTTNNKITDLRVVPFRYHKSHTPGKEYTFSIFTQLPTADVPFADCQGQLSSSVKHMEEFGWFTNKQYNIVYPTFSRESGKSRGTAMIFFDRTVPKDNIIKARLMLEHSKMTIPTSDDNDNSESENFVNIRAMWALLVAVRKQFSTRARSETNPKTGARDQNKSSKTDGSKTSARDGNRGKREAGLKTASKVGPVPPTVRTAPAKSAPAQPLTKMAVKPVPSLEQTSNTDNVEDTISDVVEDELGSATAALVAE
jgi:hypothetical protein